MFFTNITSQFWMRPNPSTLVLCPTYSTRPSGQPANGSATRATGPLAQQVWLTGGSVDVHPVAGSHDRMAQESRAETLNVSCPLADAGGVASSVHVSGR